MSSTTSEAAVSVEKKPFNVYVEEIKKSITYLAKSLSQATHMSFDDAYQELLICAWKAYQKYDPSTYKFSTFAVWRMKNWSKTLMSIDIKDNDAMQSRRCVDLSGLQDADTEHRILECPDPIDIVADIDRPNPEQLFFQRLPDPYEILCNEVLDIIEDELEQKAWQEKEVCSRKKANQHALTIFRKMRYGRRKDESGREVACTISDVARDMGMVVQRAASIFSQKIRPLGPELLHPSIVHQISDQEVHMATATTKGKKASAKKGAAKAAPKASAKKAKDEDGAARGRSPQKGGLQDKIAWLDTNFCKKGKSRADAIAALSEKYPDISLNYARTLVYTNMSAENGYDWAASERGRKKAEAPAKGKKKVAEKAPAKKTKAAPAKKTSKKAAKEEEEEAEESDAEEGDEESGEDFDL